MPAAHRPVELRLAGPYASELLKSFDAVNSGLAPCNGCIRDVGDLSIVRAEVVQYGARSANRKVEPFVGIGGIDMVNACRLRPRGCRELRMVGCPRVPKPFGNHCCGALSF